MGLGLESGASSRQYGWRSQAARMATVFVSHSAHRDKGAEPYLTRICAVLKGRHEVLLDRSGLQAGQYWNDIIINWMYMCEVATSRSESA